MTPRKRFANGERLQIVEELTPKQADKAKQRAFKEAEKAFKKEVKKNPNGRIAQMVKREEARISKWEEFVGARKQHLKQLKEKVADILSRKKAADVNPTIVPGVEFDMTSPAAPPPKTAKPAAATASNAAPAVKETTKKAASTAETVVKDALKKTSDAAKDAKGTPVGWIIGIGAAVVAAAAGIYCFATRNKNSEAVQS